MFVRSLFVWLLLGSCGLSQEWTRFRGPNGSGISDAATIPVSWGPNDYVWKAKLPGIGHSSPVLWGERLFITSSDAASGERHLICFHADTGKELWKKSLPGKTYEVHGFNTFATSTPCVDNQHVYVAWGSPDELLLMAYSHDGEEAWRKDLGPFQSQHGFGGSPIVFEDLVLLANDQCRRPPLTGESAIMAFHSKSGELAWSLPRIAREESYSCPCELKQPNGSVQLLFNLGAHGVTALDPHSGKVAWEVESLFEMRSVSSPVLAAGLIFGSCGSGAGGNYLVAVSPPGEKSPAALAYKYTEAAPYVPTPVASGDLLFLISDRGVASCIRAATGGIVWGPKRIGGDFFGSPIRVQDRIYAINTAGEVIVLSASDTYKQLAKIPLGEESHSTPAVARGKLYLRTKSQLFAVGS